MAVSRDDIVPKLVTVFRQYGYEGTTLSRISQATGLGRASLYHHFPQGKQEMAEAVLDHVNQIFAAIILAPLQAEQLPGERLALMCQGLHQFYDRGEKPCLLAIFSLGEAGELFAVSVKQAMNLWLDRLAHVLVELGWDHREAYHQAQDVVMQVQGGLLLVQILGDTAPFERILQQLPAKLNQV